MLNPTTSALLTDLYQLTMLQGYMEQGMEEPAVFEFFVRKLPRERNFLLAAGLEQTLDFIAGLAFTPEELQWVADSGRFSRDFVAYLEKLRFTGDVHAMREGTVCFPDEPLLRVTAPMPQAQLLESRLINLMHLQTLIATKAARCVLAAPDKLLVDFGFRRAHGAEAGLMAARACYLAGFAGSATVLAAPMFGVPVFGTMAHSFVQAHDDEIAAFEHFARAQPGNVVLLIDTYDTEAAAAKVVELAPRLAQRDIVIKGVRIDSGNLGEHARKVRDILDRGGCEAIGIFASSSLDEYALAALLGAGAPIDGFGIGTRLDTSSDRPYLDCVYKLQEYAGVPRRKRSEGKATWPGRKQVYRYRDDRGRMEGDLLTVEDDLRDAEALIAPVMAGGERLHPPEPLTAIRERAMAALAALPDELKELERSHTYPVRVSAALRERAAQVDAATAG